MPRPVTPQTIMADCDRLIDVLEAKKRAHIKALHISATAMEALEKARTDQRLPHAITYFHGGFTYKGYDLHT